MNYIRYEDLQVGESLRVAAHPLPAIIINIEKDGENVIISYKCHDSRIFKTVKKAKSYLLR